MKNILFMLILLPIQTIFGQTPEQQKTIDKTLKIRDSIMPCITLEEMLEQAEAQEKRIELSRKVNIKEANPIPKNTKSEDNYRLKALPHDNNSKIRGLFLPFQMIPIIFLENQHIFKKELK